jgi:hypothetical protein
VVILQYCVVLVVEERTPGIADCNVDFVFTRGIYVRRALCSLGTVLPLCSHSALAAWRRITLSMKKART